MITIPVKPSRWKRDRKNCILNLQLKANDKIGNGQHFYMLSGAAKLFASQKLSGAFLPSLQFPTNTLSG
jgi:hypothetical protein